MKLFILAIVLVAVFSEKPEYGTEHCRQVLATDCSGYDDEPVCSFDGNNYVTYMNSCEFAHGICKHHGHSLHAIYDGRCNETTTPMP
ncbi:hypothetical protein ACF0H5_017589 [Mactra antiquata]